MMGDQTFTPGQDRPAPIIHLDTERLLRQLGCTRKLRGFPYTVYMVERVKEDPEAIKQITRRLYLETAARFGVSCAAVERNLRTIVRHCWAWPDHALLEHIAGSSLCHCPTNAEFLDMMAEFLRKIA